jgi:hypothetical protein
MQGQYQHSGSSQTLTCTRIEACALTSSAARVNARPRYLQAGLGADIVAHAEALEVRGVQHEHDLSSALEAISTGQHQRDARVSEQPCTVAKERAAGPASRTTCTRSCCKRRQLSSRAPCTSTRAPCPCSCRCGCEFSCRILLHPLLRRSALRGAAIERRIRDEGFDACPHRRRSGSRSHSSR